MGNLNISPLTKVILSIVVSILILVAIGAGLLWPQYQNYQSLQQQKMDADSQLVAAKSLLDKRTSLKNDQPKLLAAIEDQKEQVPDEAGLSEVVRSLQDIAYDNGHWMTTISNSEPAQIEGEVFNAWDVTVTVEGTWLDTIGYLRDLRDMPRQVRILSVTTGLSPKLALTNRAKVHWNPGTYACRTDIVCRLYYIPEANLAKAAKDASKKTPVKAAAQGGAK